MAVAAFATSGVLLGTSLLARFTTNIRTITRGFRDLGRAGKNAFQNFRTSVKGSFIGKGAGKIRDLFLKTFRPSEFKRRQFAGLQKEVQKRITARSATKIQALLRGNIGRRLLEQTNRDIITKAFRALGTKLRADITSFKTFAAVSKSKEKITAARATLLAIRKVNRLSGERLRVLAGKLRFQILKGAGVRKLRFEFLRNLGFTKIDPKLIASKQRAE